MRLRWTVVLRGTGGTTGVLPGAPARSEVLVQCPTGTPLRHLPGLGLDTGEHLVTVHGTPLDLRTAVVGRPPLLDGAVLVVAGPGRRPRREQAPPTPHLLELVVVAGPDAAAAHALRQGRAVVGRAGRSDVVVRDPRLSREHCRLDVGPGGVAVTDLGSTNGTAPAPTATGSGPPEAAAPDGAGDRDRRGDRDGPTCTWRLGQEWTLGASRVALRAAGQSSTPTPTLATDEGTVLVPRSPRLRLPENAHEIALPPPPRRHRSTGFPVLAVLLPALAAGGLAWWTGSPVYLLLAGLGPLLAAGSWLSARRESGREGALSRREHARECAAGQDRAAAAAEALAAARRATMPDADVVLRLATGPAGRLWERDRGDDDAFRVRLGRADVDVAAAHRLVPRVTLLRPGGERGPVATADDLLSVDLGAGALGLVEPGDPSAARFVVGQLVVALAPSALQVTAVVGTAAAERWRWLTLLPHWLEGPARTADGPAAGAAARWVADLVTARASSQSASTADRPAPVPLLVVVDDPDAELTGGDLGWVGSAGDAGIRVVAVSPRPAGLPHGCGTVAVPAAADGVQLQVTLVDGSGSAGCVADRVGPWWSERLSRALAPLRGAPTDSGHRLPDRVRLADLVDTAPPAVLARWDRSGAGLAVPLGVGPGGPVTVDLVSAGPHALVAGTTGSGKSELLRAWLLSLALCHPPESVAFLLVDYKGGATFDDLARLPHTVGVLTDLDGAATARVLHSLRAEVRRRERVLADAGARDLDELRRTAPADLPDVPRLLVVVDEFRVLAEDAPEVLAEFVRLAATGRSLGLHLVLATQRPSGVVSADIRANAALRIALRVQDPAESRDVVDRADAAWLPHDRPGRAVVVGAGVDVTLQSAWVGAGEPEAADELCVSVVHPRPLGPFRAGAARRTDAGTGTDGSGGAPAVVDRVLASLARSGRSGAVSPWLPPLPARLSRDDVTLHAAVGHGASGQQDQDGTATTAQEASPAAAPEVHAAGATRLLLGLTDLPWLQRRGVLAWAPTGDGPALVLGGPRSGRSTTLAAMSRAAQEVGVPAALVDAARDDPDHVADLLAALTALPAPEDGRDGALRVLLLVDDCDTLLDPATDPTPVDLLLRVLRNGHGHGIGVAVAGGRPTAASRLAAGARVRLVHRTTDAADLVVAGVPRGLAPTALPGRCLVVGLPVPEAGTAGEAPAAVEAHVATSDATTDHPGTAAPMATDPTTATPSTTDPTTVAQHPPGAPRGPQPGSVAAVRLPRPLPTLVDRAELGPVSPSRLPLGVLAPDGVPWLLDLDDTRLLVIAGPARSGRSSALATLAAQSLTGGVGFTWLPDPDADPDARLDPDPGRTAGPGPGGRPAPQGLRHAPPGARLLLVDDVERRPESQHAAVEQWLADGTGPLAASLAPGATVVAAGSSEWFAGEFRGLAALARRHGSGVVLSPGRTDVRDVLGARDPLLQVSRRPGRGLLVDRGRTRRIQLAWPG
ncbi:FtsK/SpoIIIE domain-containing protein [Jannaschia sp. R86511]|uniref:FtsK/SpoIIIE domain-containing protein n=1 Tax=Jannaschia sp. R86511 TaxID=3093853 RepID=UPI0036D39AEC